MSSSSNPPRIERAGSLSLNPTSPFDAHSLLRRFSMPSPYTGGNTAAGQPAVHPIDPTSRAHSQVQDPAVVSADTTTVHEYNLTSRGRYYALITVTSHASNGRDPPLLYFGEELKGHIVLSRGELESTQRMDVAVSRRPYCQSDRDLNRIPAVADVRFRLYYRVRRDKARFDTAECRQLAFLRWTNTLAVFPRATLRCDLVTELTLSRIFL
jgi:hypothetical protein